MQGLYDEVLRAYDAQHGNSAIYAAKAVDPEGTEKFLADVRSDCDARDENAAYPRDKLFKHTYEITSRDDRINRIADDIYKHMSGVAVTAYVKRLSRDQALCILQLLSYDGAACICGDVKLYRSDIEQLYNNLHPDQPIGNYIDNWYDTPPAPRPNVTLDDVRFSIAWDSALKSADRTAYIEEFSADNYFSSLRLSDLPSQLGLVWDVAHMSFADIARAANMQLVDLSKKFCIPYRTIQDWHAGRRSCSPYLILMIARQLAII